jgi:phage tail-like protein
MATGTRNDPLPVFCFKVTIDGIVGQGADAYFKSVSGLKYETESIPVREGGANDTTFMLVGATKWSPLVFKNGFAGASSPLLLWRDKWMSGDMVRLGGTITQFDTTILKPMAVWTFYNGWPTKWEMTELDASKSELAIETLEITHEGLKYNRPAGK